MRTLSARLEGFAEGLEIRERAALSALLNLAATTFRERLGRLPAEHVLSAEEIALYESVRARPSSAAGLPRHLVVIVKATRLCNLRCTYCNSWRTGEGQVMSFAILCKTIADALQNSDGRSVEFVWHGGEVTLLPVDFYRKAVWLQQQFMARSCVVSNAIQTNATRVDESLFSFFRECEFSVGVSLDGPPEVNDARRIDLKGRPTSHRVQSGLSVMRSLGVKFGALAVVDEAVIELGPRRLLAYLCEIGATNVGLLNVIPNNASQGLPRQGTFVSWSKYVAFLCDLFDMWRMEFDGRLRIREFESLIKGLQGASPQQCYFAGHCMGEFVTVEPNGDVAACDKYVGDDDYKYGNLTSASLAEILRNSSQLTAHVDKQEGDKARMSHCQWFRVCNGGCPHDRRLGRTFETGYEVECCGYKPLIAKIVEHSSKVASGS